MITTFRAGCIRPHLGVFPTFVHSIVDTFGYCRFLGFNMIPEMNQMYKLMGICILFILPFYLAVGLEGK